MCCKERPPSLSLICRNILWLTATEKDGQAVMLKLFPQSFLRENIRRNIWRIKCKALAEFSSPSCCGPISLLSIGSKLRCKLSSSAGDASFLSRDNSVLQRCSLLLLSGLQIPAPGISSFVKCPRMVSQIQQCYVSLLCHPASTLLSTTTQNGGNMSEESW